MKIIDNIVIEYSQQRGIDGIYTAIRDAAVICYQTDVKKMKLSPKEFVDQVLKANGHTRPLEFGSVYLKIPYHEARKEHKGDIIRKYLTNPYSKVEDDFKYWYISTNYRVLTQGYYTSDEVAFANDYDENWYDDLEYLCEPEDIYHHKRRTFHIACSRGASDDFRTHITLSSMCESTRFCNYSQNKFGGELTFIKPYWLKDDENIEPILQYLNNTTTPDHRKFTTEDTEVLYYYRLAELGYINTARWQPAQKAKRLYPLGAKVELRLCGFDDAWQNFLWRRCDEHADPECQLVANMIKKYYQNE